MHHETLPLLHAIKHLVTIVEGLEQRIATLAEKIDEMQEEWREEYTVNGDSTDDETEYEFEFESESEQSCESFSSAPATFSYKVQRTE